MKRKINLLESKKKLMEGSYSNNSDVIDLSNQVKELSRNLGVRVIPQDYSEIDELVDSIGGISNKKGIMKDIKQLSILRSALIEVGGEGGTGPRILVSGVKMAVNTKEFVLKLDIMSAGVPERDIIGLWSEFVDAINSVVKRLSTNPRLIIKDYKNPKYGVVDEMIELRFGL